MKANLYLAWLLILAAGCTDSPHGIIIAIATDMPVPMTLETVKVTIDHPSHDRKVMTYNLDPAKERPNILPGTTPRIDPGEDPKDRVTITVSGIKGSATVVQRRARTWFLPGKLLLLRMHLLGQCVAPSPACTAAQTCTEDGCVGIDIDPATLPDFDQKTALTGPEAGIDVGLDSDAIPDGPAGDKLSPAEAAPDQAKVDLPAADVGAVDMSDPDQGAPDAAPADGAANDGSSSDGSTGDGSTD